MNVGCRLLPSARLMVFFVRAPCFLPLATMPGRPRPPSELSLMSALLDRFSSHAAPGREMLELGGQKLRLRLQKLEQLSRPHPSPLCRLRHPCKIPPRSLHFRYRSTHDGARAMTAGRVPLHPGVRYMGRDRGRGRHNYQSFVDTTNDPNVYATATILPPRPPAPTEPAARQN